ncbi:hypothetical protein I5F63_032920 [Pseudomonas aeruginosa]
MAGSPISRHLKTLPPKPYTQRRELVKSMKGVAKLVSDPRLEAGFRDGWHGTEATCARANIIGGLIARGCRRAKGRATRLGCGFFTLIDAAVPAAIADPGTTAVWEQALGHDRGRTAQFWTCSYRQAGRVISQLIAQYGSASLSIIVPQGPAYSAARTYAPAQRQERPQASLGRAAAT